MDEPPSPAHPSPPPPFYRDLRTGQSFKDVDWAGAGKGDEDDFTARKAALVEPLASGLEKMRDASNLQRADSTTSSRGHHEDYPEKFRRDFYADDYEHDFDEIDPKSEGLRNDPGFQKAGAPSPAGIEPGTAVKAHERAGGEDTLKKGSKKRPQLWGRLRSGATK
jgi:hypothetical protein